MTPPSASRSETVPSEAASCSYVLAPGTPDASDGWRVGGEEAGSSSLSRAEIRIPPGRDIGGLTSGGGKP